MTQLLPSALPALDKHTLLLRWARRQIGQIDHELRVERLALTLFALTRPLHRLGMAERNLLALAALVHDVGRSLEDADHEMHGAAMLQVAGDLPLTETERRRLMFLTRYHRGKVADAGCEDHLRPADDRVSLRILLALLRAADALDSRHLASPQIALSLCGRTLAITCYLRDVSPKALRKLGKKKKFLLLEETLKLRVAVDLLNVQEVELVA